jgi:uncharacterized protein (TIGR02145 family)
MHTKKAFSLVELIVIMVILAILWTISFIALQGYSTDARDTKRLSDINNLLSKVNIETTKWTLLEDLITYKTQTWITINNKNEITNMWIINFENLKENQESFQDPLNKEDYKFAFSEWITNINWKDESYKFIQMGTVSERNGTTQLVWNYYQIDPLTDSPSLFVDQEWNPIINGLSPMIYNPNIKPYEWVAWITQWTQDYNEKWFTRKEIVVKDWNGKGYTIMDRNLWATAFYNYSSDTESTSNVVNSSTFYWDYYQWWRNDTWITNSSNPWYTWTDWNQWPCPTWYHVPATLEWDGLVKTWFAWKWGSCTTDAWSSCSWDWNATLENFKSDLKMPFAGYSVRSGSVKHQGSHGFYWSSSPNDSTYARALNFLSSDMFPQYYTDHGNGFSVRCFKN